MKKQDLFFWLIQAQSCKVLLHGFTKYNVPVRFNVWKYDKCRKLLNYLKIKILINTLYRGVSVISKMFRIELILT